MYNILSTGSQGNAVIYHKSIMVDCGLPFEMVKPFLSDLQIVLLTHEHGDHININTLKKICFERPSLRVGCCEWMVEYVKDFKKVDVYEIGQLYNYGLFLISPVKLYHDVKNCGYRIFKDNHKTFHATDTNHLDGISAKDYDLYCIEHNYNEDTIFERIEAKEAKGDFAYQRNSINTHLSEQKARDFIYKNRKDSSIVVRLHESKI